MEYVVRRAVARPDLQGEWESPAWRGANVATVSHFHPASSDHRPLVEAKLLHDDDGIYALFRVRGDRYLVCRHTEPQSQVCKDSCVEMFLQPQAGGGYLNFETNCGGTMLLYHVYDPSRDAEGKLGGFRPVDLARLAEIEVYHSMPKLLDGELPGPVDWTVEFFVPNHVFTAHVGPLAPATDRRWRGNFYKCADESSHPHWGSWAPIGSELNFHVQECFADLRFE